MKNSKIKYLQKRLDEAALFELEDRIDEYIDFKKKR